MDSSICQGCARQGLCGNGFQTYCTGYIKATPVNWSDTLQERINKMLQKSEEILQAGKEDEE